MTRHSPAGALIACMLLISASGALAAPRPTLDANGLMAHAASTVDLRANDGTPFRLRASFWVQELGGGKSEGRYELAWRSPRAWREEFAYRGHHRVAGEDEHGPWVTTDLPYQPLRLLDVANALDVAGLGNLPVGGRVETVKTQNHRVPVLQIRLALPGRFPWSELTLRTDSGVLIRHESGPSAASGSRYKAIHEFSEYRPWHEHQFPGLIKRFDGTHQVMEVRVESIVDLAADGSEPVTRPDGAVGYPACTPQERAAGVSCDASAQRGIVVSPESKGPVAARAVVARDGRLHDIVIVESSDFLTDGNYRDYLQQWRCVPLTCGGAPVDAEVFESMGLH